jgi:hypothetical protein
MHGRHSGVLRANYTCIRLAMSNHVHQLRQFLAGLTKTAGGPKVMQHFLLKAAVNPRPVFHPVRCMRNELLKRPFANTLFILSYT